MPAPLYLALWVIAVLALAVEYGRASGLDRFPDD